MASLKGEKLHTGAQLFLRIVAIGALMAAAWLMMTSKQNAIVYGLPLEAKYSYVSAFKFFAYANAIACAITTLSLLFLFVLSKKPTSAGFFALFVHDLLVMCLTLSATAAATAVGIVGKDGNSHAGWMPICDELPKFCNKVMVATGFGYFSVVLLLILAVMSATKSRQILV